jgi:hypothetical protein
MYTVYRFKTPALNRYNLTAANAPYWMGGNAIHGSLQAAKQR